MYSEETLGKIRNSQFELTDIVNDRYGFNNKIQRNIGFSPTHKYTQYTLFVNGEKRNIYSYHELTVKELKKTVNDEYNMRLNFKDAEVKRHTNVAAKNAWENMFNDKSPIFVNKEYTAYK